MMQDCDQLDNFLCGWLDSAEAAEFKQHLAGCADCQQALELQQRIDGNIAAYREQVVIPRDLDAGLTKARHAETGERNRGSATRPSTPTRGPGLASVLVAGGVLLGIGVSLYRLGNPDTENSPEVTPITSETPDNEPVVAVTAVQTTDDAEELTSLPVSIRPGPGTIAVQVPTRSSRVSVFRVYNSIGNPPMSSGLPD